LCICTTGGNENPKIAYFHLNAASLLPKTTRNTSKYHLVTAKPPFTVKTIDWMHETGPRILLSVTHMLYVNQDRYGVGRCVKDGSCSSSSLKNCLSESQWKVLMGYLTISTNVDDIKHSTDDNFLLGRQRTGALCVQHSRTVAVLSTNTAFE